MMRLRCPILLVLSLSASILIGCSGDEAAPHPVSLPADAAPEAKSDATPDAVPSDATPDAAPSDATDEKTTPAAEDASDTDVDAESDGSADASDDGG